MAAARGSTSKPSWTPPEILGEYKLIRELGRGAMGTVYCYQDTLLDRPVAVKFIAQRRPDEAARRRFLTEARAVARLQHPNVVAVHRVGEVEGHPFLVTELVSGLPLSELPLPLPRDRVIAVGLDLARGLAAAHRRGVLHRDIKPSNAIVEDGGDVKLIDFGLAVIARDAGDPDAEPPPAGRPPGGSGSRLAGTPTYMAPETLRGEAATVASDIHSLGAVLYELCAGVAPRDTLPPDADDETWNAGVPEPLATRAGDVDPRLASIIARCLAPEPEERYPSADALADALALLLAGPHLPAPEGNPYRGLASFEASHRAVFFGRAAESRAVLDRLRETSFAVVTGDSGVGKSSLCRAGVAPLVLDGALQDGRTYEVATVLPGRQPYTALLAALAPALGADPAAAARGDDADPAELARALRRSLGRRGGVLILVDQAEELLTFSEPAEARLFAEALARLPPASPGARVLMAVRGDYFTSLASLPGLGEGLDQGLFVLRPLSREGIRAAITGPAAQHGVAFEPPDLVDTLASAARAPGGLPLLQFALAELWEARQGAKTITPALLEAVGGVEGALARHAESVLAGLSTGARTAARRLILSLVTPEGTARRRAAGELELYSIVDRSALDALVEGRLVVAREGDGGTVYELAHESLLASWEQLARWLDGSREERRLRQELEEAASFWERRGRRPEETWSAEELAAARHRARQLELALPAGIEAFLAAGERRHAALRMRARVRLVLVGVIGAAVTVGSLAVAGELRRQKIEAEKQAEALRLAGGNLGRIDLVLRPFDREDGVTTPVAVSELPGLAWRLHGVKPGDVHHPGPPLPAELVRAEPGSGGAKTEHVTRVEAPGGAAFLRIDGRGRAGERCAPSWVRVQSLPGYAARSGEVPRIAVDVPTCRASAAGMVVVPAGPFVYGGAGEPATKFPDYVEPERVVELSQYSIDRAEVSNGMFASFAAMERLTGYPAPKYPSEGPLGKAGAPEMPVTSLDAFTAEAFCRYMGKRLPGDLEWTKAARGGLTVDGRANPHPRRLFPWGVTPEDRCANAEGDADGAFWVAEVGAYPCGASPYGVMNLAGNVSEWISREGQNDKDSALRVVRGGAADSPPALEHTTTVFRNAREGRHFDFSIGVRCVASGPKKEGETWDEW